MGDDKKQWSNVIIGPWESKQTPKGKTRDQVIQEEMDSIDDLSQTAMVSLIQVLKENDVSISSKDFYRHVGFMNETLKALLYKDIYLFATHCMDYCFDSVCHSYIHLIREV